MTNICGKTKTKDEMKGKSAIINRRDEMNVVQFLTDYYTEFGIPLFTPYGKPFVPVN